MGASPRSAGKRRCFLPKQPRLRPIARCPRSHRATTPAGKGPSDLRRTSRANLDMSPVVAPAGADADVAKCLSDATLVHEKSARLGLVHQSQPVNQAQRGAGAEPGFAL